MGNTMLLFNVFACIGTRSGQGGFRYVLGVSIPHFTPEFSYFFIGYICRSIVGFSTFFKPESPETPPGSLVLFLIFFAPIFTSGHYLDQIIKADYNKILTLFFNGN